ncbi:MAG: GNAT family N-acetyltransferase [Candidatus Symbiothrix sp.]|jgi:phosphinothricin acetyltransferase|nr:GNAT family N-acetyltransferase [Candidatus Symbiothrix sp.]
MLREVKISDAARIAEIYNYYIENTIATFVKEKVSVEETEKRIAAILQKAYPYLVYEMGGMVAGYAYVNNWRPLSGYDITLETTIYLDPRFTGNGAGSRLYAELIGRAKKRGIHSLIGVLSLPNDASRKLHAKMGFQLAGVFRETGWKFNRLIDVEFWQLRLD